MILNDVGVHWNNYVIIGYWLLSKFGINSLHIYFLSNGTLLFVSILTDITIIIICGPVNRSQVPKYLVETINAGLC